MADVLCKDDSWNLRDKLRPCPSSAISLRLIQPRWQENSLAVEFTHPIPTGKAPALQSLGLETDAGGDKQFILLLFFALVSISLSYCIFILKSVIVRS